MKEDFLYYLWRLKRFDLSNLKTTKGESLQIQNVGKLNQHAGPDFLNAKIKIGETLWAGNVEMHLLASDWTRHKHTKDPAYDNVILHVVLEEDEIIFRKDGERIPCLEMKKRVPPKLSKNYKKLLHNEYWIPCQHQFFEIPDITKHLWLDRLLVERLDIKTKTIHTRLTQNKNNWETTFYEMLARNFGVKVNLEPFDLLARSVPLLLLAKYKSSLFQTEALLFGQAGLLEKDFEENYPNRLKKEYEFLKKKHRLIPISVSTWKFLRLRPPSFPTIRIALFAKLIFQSVNLFSKILEVENVKSIEVLFQIQLSEYWSSHYVFDKVSKKRNKSLGKATIHLIVINTIAPFLFLYGTLKTEEAYKDKAFQLLEELPMEQNHIISKWQELELKPASAYQTQALLQLKNEYCEKKRCLECAIGGRILDI